MLTIYYSVFPGKICPEVTEFTLNSQLAIVNDLLQDNFLFLNIKKTEVVLFGTSGNLVKVHSFTITIGVINYKYMHMCCNGRYVIMEIPNSLHCV